MDCHILKINQELLKTDNVSFMKFCFLLIRDRLLFQLITRITSTHKQIVHLDSVSVYNDLKKTTNPREGQLVLKERILSFCSANL